MTTLSDVQLQFVRTVEDAYGFDITPLLDQVAATVAAEVHGQLRGAEPWQLMVHTISHLAGGYVVGYGRPLHPELDRRVALAAVLFEVSEDLGRTRGVWLHTRRVIDAFTQALRVFDAEHRELRQWVEANDEAARMWRQGGARLDKAYLARLRLLRKLLSEVARVAQATALVGALPEVAGLRGRTRGRPSLDTLMAAEEYLLLCGYTAQEVVALLVLRDGDDELPEAAAVRRLRSRHRQRRQRAKPSN